MSKKNNVFLCKTLISSELRVQTEDLEILFALGAQRARGRSEELVLDRPSEDKAHGGGRGGGLKKK